MFFRSVVAVATISLAAGCGGSGSSTSSGVNGPVSSISDVRSELDRLSAESGTVVGTTSAQMPRTGQASYKGIAAFAFGADSTSGDAVGGELTMDMSLTDDTVSGRISRFYGRDGSSRDGQLNLSNGVIARHSEGVALAANLEGQVEFLNDTRDMTGVMLGAFGGETAEFARGEIALQFPVDLPGSLATAVPEVNVEGAFVVEQQ